MKKSSEKISDYDVHYFLAKAREYIELADNYATALELRNDALVSQVQNLEETLIQVKDYYENERGKE